MDYRIAKDKIAGQVMFPLDHRLQIPGNHHGGGTVYQVGTDIEPIDTHPFDGRSGKDDSAGDTRFILQSGCHEDRSHRRLCRSNVYGRILRSYSSWTEPAGSYPPIERVLPVERPRRRMFRTEPTLQPWYSPSSYWC